MPKFIKLTDYNTNDICYVNICIIIGMIWIKDRTRLRIIDINDDNAVVKETPEKILKLIAECEDN